MKCIQCLDALDESTSVNGSSSTCLRCGIEHLSLGRLIRLSDSYLMTRIWTMIQSEAMRENWKRMGACTLCSHEMIGVPFKADGEAHALIVCFHCYLITMKSSTLRVFMESNIEFKAKQLAVSRANVELRVRKEIQQDARMLRQIANIILQRLISVLEHPRNSDIRVSVLLGMGSLIVGAFTMLLPFSSMEMFGGGSLSILFTSLTHVTFFQLAWNLFFFMNLSPECERELGSLKYLLLFCVVMSVSIPLGKLISPFDSVSIIGLAPWIAALIGRKIALGKRISVRVPFISDARKSVYVFHPKTLGFIFVLFELRTMIPTGGGIRWFSLSACLCAGILSAALTCWRSTRGRTVQHCDARTEKNVVLVRQSGVNAVKRVA